MAHKQKRLSIAVSDDLYEWIVEQAHAMGLPPSTYGTVMLNEFKRSKESNEKMMDIMKSFASSSPKDWTEMVQVMLDGEQKKLLGNGKSDAG